MIYAILNKPQLPENTGMAIRALANTGFVNLRLVSPLHPWPSDSAHLASAATSHLLNIELFDDLKRALADLHFTFATSARDHRLIKKIFSPTSAALEISKKSDRNIGIVFGSERSGLTNKEISLCSAIIEIPTANFSSYNLAQAVLLIFYELFSQKIPPQTRLKTGKTAPATQNELEKFLSKLEEKLSQKNYFPDAQKQVLMMQTLRNIFNRSELTSQEIKSLFGAFLSRRS